MRIHAYICMHACTYIYMSLPVNISTHIHVDVCADVSRCVYVCAYVSMHTFVLLMLHACELFRNRYTLTKHPTSSTPNIHNTICLLRHCRRARDNFAGAPGTAINAPPWHLQHHTSHRNTICIPTLCMPTPHTSMKQFHPAARAPPSPSLHAYIYICMSMHIYAHTCIYLHACMYVYLHVAACKYTSIHPC